MSLHFFLLSNDNIVIHKRTINKDDKNAEITDIGSIFDSILK